MTPAMIVQAWKNPEYRASLPLEQRTALPENPSGNPLTDLEDSELGDVAGGQVLRVTHPDVCCFFTLQCPTLSLTCRDLEA
ncbi:mersacidin/lichenicidin family type 2 lantibiotic [Stigmatella sp. ncwal1]|uniref:Mersacidin/lichenicidin family type 2 lantibiotic n=1 Tax=Stigmatella ashevillensis TaxID=2995309 RepID=A0ABT5DK80_9BACT|nr:mersacidin/lichenicidin family type 2 lantibiotic [Stigmatella ashevillena]MDC0713533.1 mersacidin/lichenicidin family type 2 lantibiotic [Stigmatella ashevillena]